MAHKCCRSWLCSCSCEYLPPFPHFATNAIHYAQEPEQWNSRAVVPPITLTVSFKQEDLEKNKQKEPVENKQEDLWKNKQEEPRKKPGYVYTRFGNPSRHILEEVVGTLDGAQSQGHHMDWSSLAAADGAKFCLAYSSGMGAIMNVCHLLKTGDQIICTDDVYSGTRDLFKKLEKNYCLDVVYVDCTDPKKLEAAITPKTKLVWLESPTNPTLKVIDIQACADVAHKKKDVLVAVDNSLMSPYFQRPLSLGADICMTSATKYINGHSDVLIGVVSVNREDLYKELKSLQIALGAVPSPFDCYMCNRGLKTLHIRMKLHFQNGLAVAKFLESHRRVEKVIYPGLCCHPQYKVTKRQNSGVSGVVSFYINGNKHNALAFLENLKVFTVGLSLGGFESLAEHPATMTHKSVREDIRESLGITDTLIRLSVGLEDEEDLLADLDQALEAAFA
ncbi:cystathionine gamma-lyase-like [Sylvia atricapilla]|uniref:cystathionine gamma-lyase-like n=1 Tax=Sylvia atricapilla TaxID=48155 RepID=UPI003391108D